QYGGKLLRRQSVAQRASEMRLELVHAAKAGNHAKIEDAAITRLEGVIAPHRAPAICREQFLELPVEVVRVGDCAINVVVAEHLSAHGHPAVVKCLVHRSSLPVAAVIQSLDVIPAAR